MTSRDLLIDWLNDAYAMEKGMEETLEQHAKDAKDDPEVVERINHHIEETRDQARIVGECIETLGGSISRLKGGLASLAGSMQGRLNKPAWDTMVKNSLADYASEYFEIASYTALVHAARELGEDAVADKLADILHQEQEMAAFLEKKLPEGVSKALAAANER